VLCYKIKLIKTSDKCQRLSKSFSLSDDKAFSTFYTRFVEIINVDKIKKTLLLRFFFVDVVNVYYVNDF